MVITLNPLLKFSAGQWNTLVNIGLALCGLAGQDCIGTNTSSIYNASTEEPVDLISVALIATLRLCPVLGMASEGRLAAIVDFTFNLGPGRLQTSTLRRRLNQANWEGAAEELQRWVIAEAGYFPGLLLEKPRSYF